MMMRVSSPVFVGRSDELDRMAEALRQAGDEDPAFILVAGEAGVGKTRLVSELAARARAAGFRVLSGGCIELGEGGLPFAPIVEALRPLASELPPQTLEALVGPGRNELLRLIPELAIAGAPVDDDEYGSAQGRLFEFVLLFLRRLAALQPILLVVEDLHWADRSTLDLLRFLVRNLREGPLVLVATYRSDELHRRRRLLPVLAELTRSGRIERLELARFGRAELAAQLAGITGAEPDRGLVERIYARSEGNAFYSEELLAADVSGERLPPTLREVLLVRVAALSEAARELLRVASVARGPVAGELLAAVMDVAESSLFPVLHEAVTEEILVVNEAGTAYAFRHALTGEAVADELLPGERTALHAAYARELSRDPGWTNDPARSAAVAAHWTAAHDLPRAFEASVAAGLAAEGGYAFAEAQAQYERALQLWGRIPDTATMAALDRVALLEHAASAASGAGLLSREIAHLEVAVASLDSALEPVRAGLLYDRLGRAHVEQANGAAALTAHLEAVRLVPSEPLSAARARVLGGLGRYQMVTNRYQEAALVLNEAIEVARLVGAHEIEGDALNSRATNMLLVGGDPEVCIADLRRARAIALENGNATGVARADLNLCWVLLEFGRLEDAATISLEAFADAERNGLLASHWGVSLVFMAATSLRYLGRWDESEQVQARARLASDDEGVAINFYLARAPLDVGRGRFGRAHPDMGALARLTGRTEDVDNVTQVACSRAELALWEARPLEAREVLAETAARLDTMPAPLVHLLGMLYTFGLRAEADLAGLARTRRAHAELEESRTSGAGYLARMRALSDEVGLDRPFVMSWTTAHLALAEAEHTRLEGASDPARWSAAAVAFDALGMPFERAYTLYREAEARLMTKGSRGGARDPLRTAHGIATHLGAEPLRREIEATAQRARIDLSPSHHAPAGGPKPAAPFGLTPRELEVLQLVVAGRTNREIADQLFVSENTAGVHVSNILGKLGVSRRMEAAAIASSLELVQRKSANQEVMP
jgi:DNA-binding CsgD family transcriptional regulator/tetratricopeptide (TPR) repeat protein